MLTDVVTVHDPSSEILFGLGVLSVGILFLKVLVIEGVHLMKLVKSAKTELHKDE